jgi:hypothetical protein
MKIKLPNGWEKCRTGIKGVRKWRNLATQCWVTDRYDDPNALYCGKLGVPLQWPRNRYTVQMAIDCLDFDANEWIKNHSNSPCP